MMQFKIGVEMVDGTEAVAIASVPDLLAFERKFDKPVTEFGAGLRLEWILWLAWHALHRAGKTSEDYDDWTAKVETLPWEARTVIRCPLWRAQHPLVSSPLGLRMGLPPR